MDRRVRTVEMPKVYRHQRDFYQYYDKTLGKAYIDFVHSPFGVPSKYKKVAVTRIEHKPINIPM